MGADNRLGSARGQPHRAAVRPGDNILLQFSAAAPAARPAIASPIHGEYQGVSSYSAGIPKDEASLFLSSQRRSGVAKTGMIGCWAGPTKGYKTLQKIICPNFTGSHR